MSRLIHHNLYIYYSLVLVLFIVNVFLKNEALEYIVGLLALPMLFISYLGAAKLFRILGTVFVLIGLVLFLYAGLPLYEIPFYMTSTMPLLAFLAVLPWMNSVVRAGRFDRRINQLMKSNVEDLGKLYVRTSLTTYTLVSFINLSALSLTQNVLIENMTKFKKTLRDAFISRTTLRAFAIALAWSPMEIMVAITVDTTGVSYLTYLPWLLLCSVIILVIDTLWGKKAFQNVPYEPAVEGHNRVFSPKEFGLQILHLLVVLTTFLAIVVFVGNQFNLNFILTVTLVILPFACIWALFMKKWRSFLAIGWGTWKARTNGMQNFVVLFLSLAFFSSSLNETPFLQLIQEPFLAASGYPIIILLLIQFMYLGMSMIGVHPVATVGVLMEVLPPLYDVMNPLSIGMVLITGALATATVGTYGVTVTMTSMNTIENPYRIMLRNMPFALLYGGIGTLIAYLLL
ncbi:hypothetical protein [Halalkalibacterium ligniniphilum]|uniref:hypothetical protein n=1 Tax=Halalkalibacterium ligniniphilum TaxID=1134413 RepID=UPI000344AD5E|nr:hypothetical protein [Halalkalibacterium ligniniphilum]